MTPHQHAALLRELADALDAWQLGGSPPETEEDSDAELIDRARAAADQLEVDP